MGIIPEELNKFDKEQIRRLEILVAEEVKSKYGEVQTLREHISNYYSQVLDGKVNEPPVAIGNGRVVRAGYGKPNIYGNTELDKAYVWTFVKALDEIADRELTEEFIDLAKSAHFFAQGFPVMAYFIEMARTPEERGRIIQDEISDKKHAELRRRMIGLIHLINRIAESTYTDFKELPFYRMNGKDLTSDGMVLNFPHISEVRPSK